MINIKNNNINYVEYGVGQGKVVLIINDRAYGFYNTENGYLFSKQNYNSNYLQFNYPCMGNISFNDDLKCIIMDKVSGVQYSDIYHDKIVVKRLLELEVSSVTKLNSENEVYFLQHGDANRVNIVWNKDNFVFIDLDNINYYPPLLDVFHYLCVSNYNLHYIVSLLQENICTVKQIAEISKIDINGNYLDEFFYRYVLHYIKIKCCFDDFKFLTVDNTIEFPKTNEILSFIKAK